MAITLRQYWLALQNSLNEFDTHNKVPPKNEEDTQSYMKQRVLLESLMAIGIAIEDTSVLFKLSKAAQLEELPKQVYGSERIVTSFAGPLSLVFAEEVYLQHVKRFSDVTLDDQRLVIQAAVSLKVKQADARSLAEKLEAAIGSYKAIKISQSPVILFAPPKEVKALEATEEQLSSAVWI
jgi:hypothetical protein